MYNKLYFGRLNLTTLGWEKVREKNVAIIYSWDVPGCRTYGPFGEKNNLKVLRSSLRFALTLRLLFQTVFKKKPLKYSVFGKVFLNLMKILDPRIEKCNKNI